MYSFDLKKLNKYEITERMTELKEVFEHPDTNIFDMPHETYEEVLNPRKDEDGYIPYHYLSDSVKALLKMNETMKVRKAAQDRGIKLRQPRPIPKRR